MPCNDSPAGLPWMPIARAEMGVRPYPPHSSNPRITAYHHGTNLQGYDDKVAWCSSFVNWTLAQAGIGGTGSGLARSWLTWGKPLQTPCVGCIAVLTREDPTGWKGHVGFYLRAEAGEIHLLGGNQLDEVREHAYPIATVLGYRWPLDWPLPNVRTAAPAQANHRAGLDLPVAAS